MWGIVVFVVMFAAAQAADDNLIVQLHDGKVQGTTISTPGGMNFYTWRHIPYAKPPLGNLRFHPPERPDKWDDILDGSKDSYACIFVSTFEGDPEPTYGNSEDCLYISVYSPVPPNSTLRLPVLLSIYGGGFTTGTADASFLDPAPFMEEDVIIVSFNYRLGIFGFLSTGDDPMPGNSALKDQHQALLWTKENVHFFGGNPLDITIFGESAGAMSVGYHLTSPMSRNLFNGAIMQSGSCLKNFIQKNARNNAVTVAQRIDSSITTSNSSEEIVTVLQSADVELLVNLTADISFRPVMEHWNQKPFIFESFYEALERADFTHIPVIIGTNSEEDMVNIDDIDTAIAMAAAYDSDKTLLTPEFYNLKADASISDLTDEIKLEYAGNGSFSDNVGSLVNFLSEDDFLRSSMEHAILQSKYTPVYFYQFSFVGTRSINRPEIPGCGRVAHADDVPYLFNVSTKPIETDADYLTRRRLVKLWVNFARTKNPTPDDDSSEELKDVKWEQFTETDLQYLDIGDKLEMKSNLKGQRAQFWQKLWEKYAEKPYNTF